MKYIHWFVLHTIYIVFCFFFSLPLYAQSNSISDSDSPIRIADFRGKPTNSVIYSAISATREGVVVVLVRGCNDELWNEIHGHLKALTKAGYTRIGLMRSDLDAGETLPVVGVLSDGTIYATIKDVKANGHHGWSIYNLVRDAYKEHVIPKIKNASAKTDTKSE